MAIEDDIRRRRERQREEDEEDAKKLALKRGGPATVSSEKLIEYLERAETLIDQLENNYRMFINGIEKLPPRARRKQLDELIVAINFMGKSTQALLFRASGVIARYNTHSNRWDRLCRDLENGKIKRTAGPATGRGPLKRPA